jgi:hypothetical protein
MLSLPAKLGIASLMMITVVATVTASAAANVVPPTKAGSMSAPQTVAQLRPPQCAGLTLTNLVIGSGRLNGTGANDLILASSGRDDINGRGGSDCIVAGGGNDALSGGGGGDVLMGGPGNDTLRGGGAMDTCYGGGGIDVWFSCTFLP